MTIRPDPAAIVRAFLAATERRDTAAAAALVAPQVSFSFPGRPTTTDLATVMAATGSRYRRVGKAIEGVDVYGDVAQATVFVRGTLAGVFADGRDFAGIRFIDRFELVDGLIVSQQVWNDTGEALLRRRDGEPT